MVWACGNNGRVSYGQKVLMASTRSTVQLGGWCNDCLGQQINDDSKEW